MYRMMKPLIRGLEIQYVATYVPPSSSDDSDTTSYTSEHSASDFGVKWKMLVE